MAILSKAYRLDNFEGLEYSESLALGIFETLIQILLIVNLWKTLQILTYVFHCLHSVSYFFFLYLSPSSSLCTVFDSFSSNIDKVLSINPSANVFVFGDFNVHHKDWLSYSGGTDRSGELCYNFSLSNNLTWMLNFPTRIPDCSSHSPALLDFFLSYETSICSTMAFPPLGNSDHVVASVSTGFPSYSQQDVPFHCLAYDYPLADWGSLTQSSTLTHLHGFQLLVLLA